jgi:hypothetical protein
MCWRGSKVHRISGCHAPRVCHVILPDQLVLGIRIHVVLVAVEALAVLLGPARVPVFLPLRRVRLPRLRRLARLQLEGTFEGVPPIDILSSPERSGVGPGHFLAQRVILSRLTTLLRGNEEMTKDPRERDDPNQGQKQCGADSADGGDSLQLIFGVHGRPRLQKAIVLVARLDVAAGCMS